MLRRQGTTKRRGEMIGLGHSKMWRAPEDRRELAAVAR
jgi:hypothetical protein